MRHRSILFAATYLLLIALGIDRFLLAPANGSSAYQGRCWMREQRLASVICRILTQRTDISRSGIRRQDKQLRNPYTKCPAIDEQRFEPAYIRELVKMCRLLACNPVNSNAKIPALIRKETASFAE